MATWVRLTKNMSRQTDDQCNSVSGKDRYNPQKSRGLYSHSPLGEIIQSKIGFADVEGGYLFDFTITEPVPGKINIPYIRDIPHLQSVHAHGRLRDRRLIHEKLTARAHDLQAFLTMTDALADQIRTEYNLGANIPHGLFRCYPTGAICVSSTHRRQEIVYLDNQSMYPVGFLEHLRFLALLANETGLPTKFVSRRMEPDANKLMRRVSRKAGSLQIVALADYDFRSYYGILQNTNNFNQAGVALNRKLLMYLACGMKPVIHRSFVAAIHYCRSVGVMPLVFETVVDIALTIKSHNFGSWDPKFFDMDARIPDLKSELRRLVRIVQEKSRPSSTITPGSLTGDLVASMATIPERLPALEAVVRSIEPQVRRLNVYLNGHKVIPECLKPDWITVACSQQHGNRGDAGKFFWCEEITGYHLTIDDDIIYPPGYVERCLDALDQRGFGVIVSMHGRVFRRPRPRGFHGDSDAVCHWRQRVVVDTPVHVPGTGCMAYHAASIRLRRSDFKMPNMADVWVGLAAQEQRVPCIALAHEAEWLSIAPGLDGTKTIYDAAVKNDTKESRLVTQITWRRFPDPLAIMRRLPKV